LPVDRSPATLPAARADPAPHRHTPAAFNATAATLPLGSVAYEPERTATSGYFIWPTLAADKLRSRIVLCIGLS
jgi:hypothetical protein